MATKKTLQTDDQRIIEWLKKVRFRKQLFGGVNEQDVWKKIDELNRMYEASLSAERMRYDDLIAEYKRSAITTIEKYRQAAKKADTAKNRTHMSDSQNVKAKINSKEEL